MSMKIKLDLSAFKAQLRATVDELHRATRPAAQAGAEIIYRQAKLNCPVFKDDFGNEGGYGHYFHGTHKVYGPYYPGNLRDSIYQVFSKDNSYKDVSTYHISWNADKAPYGWMVELGTSRASAHSFVGRAIKETRSDVIKAIKATYIAEVNKK